MQRMWAEYKCNEMSFGGKISNITAHTIEKQKKDSVCKELLL
jgi:hypothetical protein